MENLEPIRNETKIDLDNVAKEYAEKLRSEIFELKEKQADPHLKNINPDELTFEDLMIYDKFRKNALAKNEFEDYREHLREYFREQRMKKRNNFDLMFDSRSNLSAMILNRLVAREDAKRHPESPAL